MRTIEWARDVESTLRAMTIRIREGESFAIDRNDDYLTNIEEISVILHNNHDKKTPLYLFASAAEIFLYLEHNDKALKYAEMGTDEFSYPQDKRKIADNWQLRARVELRLGDYTAARRSIQHAIYYHQDNTPTKNLDALSIDNNLLAEIALAQKDIRTAKKANDFVIEHSRNRSNHATLAGAYRFRTVIAYEEGDINGQKNALHDAAYYHRKARNYDGAAIACEQLARIYQQEGNFKQAKKILRDAGKDRKIKYNTYAAIQETLADITSEEGDINGQKNALDDAIYNYEKAHNYNSAVINVERLAKIYQQEGDFKQARKILKKAEKYPGKDESTYVTFKTLLAKVEFKLENYDAAREAISIVRNYYHERTIENKTPQIYADVFFAKTELKLGSIKSAYTVMTEVNHDMEMHDIDESFIASSKYLFAKIALKARDLGKARDFIQEAIKYYVREQKNEKSQLSFYTLAKIEMEAGNIPEAHAAIDQAITLGRSVENNNEGLLKNTHLQGLIFSKEGNYEKAYHAFLIGIEYGEQHGDYSHMVLNMTSLTTIMQEHNEEDALTLVKEAVNIIEKHHEAIEDINFTRAYNSYHSLLMKKELLSQEPDWNKLHQIADTALSYAPVGSEVELIALRHKAKTIEKQIKHEALSRGSTDNTLSQEEERQIRGIIKQCRRALKDNAEKGWPADKQRLDVIAQIGRLDSILRVAPCSEVSEVVSLRKRSHSSLERVIS